MYCCNKDFNPHYSFYCQDKNYVTKRIEFGYCPNCHKAIYKEFKIDFRDNISTKLLRGYEAERAFNKAMFDRLVFISKVKQGTRAKQYWCYGDCKESKKDGNGQIIQFQIKRNMNGEEIENLGVSKVLIR